jgi:hypothetical protein
LANRKKNQVALHNIIRKSSMKISIKSQIKNVIYTAHDWHIQEPLAVGQNREKKSDKLPKVNTSSFVLFFFVFYPIFTSDRLIP